MGVSMHRASSPPGAFFSAPCSNGYEEVAFAEIHNGCVGCVFNTFDDEEDRRNCNSFNCRGGLFLTKQQYLTYRLTGIFQ